MLSPHPEKWGGGALPPRPPPIDARVHKMRVYVTFVYALRTSPHMYIGVSACKVPKCRLCSSGDPNTCERCDVGYVELEDGWCEGKCLVTK